MANYTLHLGFDWNSPLIGAIWKPGSMTDSYRFLQYALALTLEGAPKGVQAVPAWFVFTQGDTFSVRVWDLSASPVPMNLTLDMSISETDAAETYNPNDYLTLSRVRVWQNSDNTQYYFTFNQLSGPENSPLLGPWGTSSFWYSSDGSVAFATSPFICKLSFRLTAAPQGGGDAQVYVSDPEVIVGSMGRPH